MAYISSSSVHTGPPKRSARRIPIGLGLTLGACASLALWSAIGIGLRAIFFA